VEGKHHIRLAFPIPLFLFLIVTDLMDDLSALLFLFGPNTNRKIWHGMEISPSLVMRIVGICCTLSRELVLHAQPVDLADIDVTGEMGRVRVRCLLR
jgi:hypothetical protein